MSKKKYRTDILFPRSNFLIGAGSAFNLYGKYFEFNTSESEEIADAWALLNDWGVTADDIRSTIKKNPKLELEKTH